MHKVLILILLNAALAACDGSSSSGGGTTNTDPGSTFPSPDTTSVAGTYLGSETVTFTIPGELTETRSGTITVTIEASGNVTLVDEEGVTFTGPLSGDRFTAQGTAQFVEQGISCSGTATYVGTVFGDRVSGSSSGSGTCARGNVSLNISASGIFTATKT